MHPVAGEAVAQRPDDRDGAADGRLVVQLRADLLGDREQLGAVGREQRLVGGDDVGAGVHRELEVLAGRLEAADQLDDDVGAEDQRLGVGREQMLRDVGGALRLQVAHRDAHQLEPGADAAGELVAVLEQQGRHLGAHGPGAEDGDAEVAVFDHRAVHSHVAAQQVFLGLAAHDDARLAVAHGDDRGTAEVVVVARERPAVGAGRGHGDQVAGRDVPRQVVGVHDDVAALAVLAGDAHQGRVGIRDPVRDPTE